MLNDLMMASQRTEVKAVHAIVVTVHLIMT